MTFTHVNLKSKAPVAIRQLAKDCPEAEIEAAVGVMNDAFGFNKPPPDGKNFLAGKKIFVPNLHRAQIKCGLLAGSVYIAESPSGEVQGAAVWFGPGRDLLLGSTRDEQLHIWHKEFLEVIRTECPNMPAWWTDYFAPDYKKFTDEALGDTNYKFDAWQLQLLGVLGKEHGRGIGSELIKVVKEEASRRNDPREQRLTVEAGPVKFYESHGFVDKGMHNFSAEKSLEISTPWEMHCMSYDPKEATSH